VTDTTPPYVSVDDLTIGWGSTVLMEHVSFEVARGTTFVILGGSGCGKSEELPPFGVMFQSGALFGSMTLAENLALPLTTWSDARGAAADRLVQGKLELVGLGPFGDHLPGEISGGMKKRAGIARALMLEPELLFLDEPSAGLDPISAVELDDLIVTLNRVLGITIVVVTHELDSIFRIADQCIVLDKDARGAVALGDPRLLRDTSQVPFVHNFFNRTSPNLNVED
jgi:phospholipid/cholesterol/gamma-HCH transport system ATP-binding protein